MSSLRPRFGIIYALESRPPVLETFFIAFQHTLAMFVGIITPPLIIAAGLGLPPDETSFFVSMALFASGISTVTQVMRVGPVGTGLLSVQGTSFTFVGPALAAGAVGGIPLMLGMSILAAPVEIILSFVLGFARRLFAPVVTGTAVMMIGFSLIHVGMTNFAGGVGAKDFGSARNLGLGLLVIVVIIFFNRFGRGVGRIGAVTFGLGAGYVVAGIAGVVDFRPVREADWLLFPTPFHYGLSFDLRFLAPFAFSYFITTLESVGDITATSQVSGEPVSGPIYMQRVRGGVLADGLNSILAAVFNSLPNTTFAQNNGVIQLTGVASRVVGYATAVILMALGLMPKLGALLPGCRRRCWWCDRRPFWARDDGGRADRGARGLFRPNDAHSCGSVRARRWRPDRSRGGRATPGGVASDPRLGAHCRNDDRHNPEPCFSAGVRRGRTISRNTAFLNFT